MSNPGNLENPTNRLRELLDLLQLYKKFPEMKIINQYYNGNNVKYGVFLLALSGNAKIIDLIRKIYEEDIKQNRKQFLVDVDEGNTVENGKTDLYTYGNLPCSVYLINGKTLMHLPLDMETISGMENLKRGNLSLFQHFFETRYSQSIIKPEPIGSIEVMPGEMWRPDEAKKLGHLLPGLYPGSYIKVHKPGSHVIWVGNSPLHNGEIRSVIYERNSKKFIRNI